MVERFPDEIGDWRICILTPFGSRVHAPWALALEERLTRADMPVQVLWSDDGIILRLPEAIEDIPLDLLLFEPDEVEDLVVERLPSTSLFASRFRENAARSLLLPRRRPGERTPLWQQRQRAADLLEVASGYPSFPMLLETTRECLRDVFDLPALREVLGDIRSRKLRVVPVETKRASPFAQSLLFGWIAVYMYEGDAPLAERRAAALALDRDLLRDLLGAEELRELLDPEVLAELELELQRLVTDRGTRATPTISTTCSPISARSTSTSCAARSDRRPAAVARRAASAQRRVIRAGDRYAAAEDAARLRDALGIALPAGLPDRVHRSGRAAARRSRRALRAHARAVHGRGGRRPTRRHRRRAPTARCARLERRRSVCCTASSGPAAWNASGATRTCCACSGAGRSRRCGTRSNRSTPPTFARFLPAWQGVGRGRRGLDALVETLEQLQGVAIPASVLERDVLPGTRRGLPARRCSTSCARPARSCGSVRGRSAPTTAASACYFRDRIRLLAPGARRRRPTRRSGARRAARPPRGRGRIVLARPRRCRRVRTSEPRGEPPRASEAVMVVVLTALWDLVWAGEVTNDTFGPLRVPRRTTKRTPRAKPNLSRLSRLGSAGGRGAVVARRAAARTRAEHRPRSRTRRRCNCSNGTAS